MKEQAKNLVEATPAPRLPSLSVWRNAEPVGLLHVSGTSSNATNGRFTSG